MAVVLALAAGAEAVGVAAGEAAWARSGTGSARRRETSARKRGGVFMAGGAGVGALGCGGGVAEESMETRGETSAELGAGVGKSGIARPQRVRDERAAP